MASKDLYIFPAVFHYTDSGVGVTFPDLPGCVSYGNDEKEAFQMAQEALTGHLYVMKEQGEKIPEPSRLEEINLDDYREEGERAVLVLISISKRAVNDVGNKSVKKTLTIPKWLNDLAEKEQVNFSQILQEGLKRHLGVS